MHAGEVISDEDILFYLFVIKKFIFQISVDCSNTNEIEEYLSKLNNIIFKKTLDNLNNDSELSIESSSFPEDTKDSISDLNNNNNGEISTNYIQLNSIENKIDLLLK